MRERIRKFIALLMAVLLLDQLPGFEVLMVKAAEVTVTESPLELTADTTGVEGNTYVLASGASIVNVNAGVTVGEISATYSNDYTINNSGTINTLSVNSGAFIVSGGTYGSITVGEYASFTGTGISATNISATGDLYLNETNGVANLSAQTISGTGNVTVTDELSVQTIDSVVVNVNKDTVINSSTNDLTLYYNGIPYTIAAGSTGTSIAKENGVLVTFKTTDENVSWVPSEETANLNTYLMAGETTGTYICTAADGYYFPVGYILRQEGDGSGTLTAIREDESTLTVSYTVSNTDVTLDTLTITFPALSKILVDGSGELTIADIAYGESLNPVITSSSHTQNDEVIEYKISGADDSTYDVNVPTLVGSYDARIILHENDTYKELILETSFNIVKAEGTATFTVEDITEGETVSPQISSTVYDVDSATVEYKASGADDTTYATDIPTEVGSYIARVIFAANDFYNQLTMTDEFVIESAPKEEIPEEETPEEETTETPEKDATEEPTTEAPETDNTEDEEIVELQPGTGSLVVPDAYYGTSVNPQITSATNTVAGVSVEYKVLGASDATYTTKAPTAVGKYVARVTLPSSNDYKEVVLIDEFAIDYLPVPANVYTLVGNTGDNGYYTSEVNVVAREGYVISNSLNGEYVEKITISSSQASTIVYFMDENTGAKTNGVSISAINIDVDAPEVDADGDDTYYGDSLAVAISDDNLASVTLNGENVKLEQNRTILDLKSDGGIEKYTIVVTDTAGHTRNITITVAAEWTRTGEIPSGVQVKLEAGKYYTLGQGNWSVDGDNTSYSGNTTFYVGKEGKYTFTKQ